MTILKCSTFYCTPNRQTFTGKTKNICT